MRVFLMFVVLLPLVAAEQGLVKLGPQQAEQVWGGINPDDLSLPQADGVIQVINEPNGGQNRIVRFVATRPLRGKLVGRIVTSNGSAIQLEGFDLDCCGSPFAPMVELWDGRFPPFWSAGPTRFEIFHSEGGKVTKVSAFVNTFFQGPIPGPVLGDILPTRVDGRPYLVVPGPFKTKDVRVMVGWVTAKPSFNQLGQMAFLIPTEYGFFDGDHTLTVCESGLCTTRVVYINNVFPPPPPYPDPPPA